MKKPGPWILLGGFLYLWLMVGFVMGTVTLLGPVRWTTSGFRTAGWSGESAAVIALILLLVVTSLLVSRLLLRWALHSQRRGLRLGIPAVATLAAALTTWAWMTPGAVIGGDPGAIETVRLEGGAEFVFGPYPDEARLESLSRQGYTGVVSLLHPAVVPFEPKLLKDERGDVEDAGLRFIHAPMLPWVGDNEASLDRVRALAREGKGRYYVHCYLGRDRANAVKRVVAALDGAATAGEELEEARTLAEREDPFERGPVEQLAEGVWLSPFPNDHELYGYFLFAKVGHVVSTLDTTDARQRGWSRHAADLLEEYAVPHSHWPVLPRDSSAARDLARRVERLPKPVIIMVARTAPADSADVAALVRRALPRAGQSR